MIKTHQIDCRHLARIHDISLTILVLACLAIIAGPVNAQTEPPQSEIPRPELTLPQPALPDSPQPELALPQPAQTDTSRPELSQPEPAPLLRPGLVEELGLWWGMSSDDVLALGDFSLEYMGRGDGGDHFAATGFPPALPDLVQIILYFGFDDRLWRMAFLSFNEHDTSGVGTALFVRYDDWKSVLDEMYGVGQSYHRNTSTDVRNPGNILKSLRAGSAWHFTEYESNDQHVQLGIKGTSWNAGHTALYIKNLRMAEKVQMDLEMNQQSTN